MNIFEIFIDRKRKLDELAAERRRVKQATARITIKSRIDEVLDGHRGTVLFSDIVSSDPLEFPGYAEKVATLVKRTSHPEAFICKTGSIMEQRVVCCELLPEFLMGSMGSAVGEAVCRSAEYALEQGMPLIVFCASGGARMQEGMFSLMQMAKTSAAIARLQTAGGLYISVLTHPTTGGVTASFAMQGDIIIAEPGALIGFAGPRVIEQTIATKLPEGFQSAEFQLEHGFVDLLCERGDLRQTLAALLQLHSGATGDGSLLRFEQAQQRTVPCCAALTAQQHLELARASSRPHVYDFIDKVFDDFIELHGDRCFGDDRALVAGLASFEGMPVTVAGHLKGSDLNSNIAANFGMPHPEGYRKFVRLAKQAAKFGRPVITFIDTPGAYPGAQAEERGQGEAIARCLFELSELSVPIVAIVTGEGGSGGALALGVADRIAMLEHAVYAVLSPEGFASILWKDASRAAEASALMKITAPDLYGFGMIDAIIAEPVKSAENNEGTGENDTKTPVNNAKNPQISVIAALSRNPALADADKGNDAKAQDELFASVRTFIRGALADLLPLQTEELLAQRYQRFRRF